MEIDRNILVRYFLGQATKEEKENIRQWLERDENHQKQFMAERIRFDASLMIEEDEISIASSSLYRQIYTTFLKGAAILLLLIGFGYLVKSGSSPQQEINMQYIYVPAGSRTSVTLPDGTLVWLNANTSLRFPGAFSGTERHVELNGEAYFEVSRDKKRPFIVKTDKYNIEVLGTSFNVEAYAGRPTFETTLFSGKVKLYKENEKDAFYLRPGESAEYINNAIHISRKYSEGYRWKEGLIVIENRSFEEIMQLFEKYFDLEILIENEQVKDLGYDGKLRIADGIDHALRVLQNDFSFTYKRDESVNKIYIY